MTDEQFQALKSMIDNVLSNQIIIDGKLDRLQREVSSIQHDVHVVIKNQRVLGDDQDELIDLVKAVKKQINK